MRNLRTEASQGHTIYIYKTLKGGREGGEDKCREGKRGSVEERKA